MHLRVRRMTIENTMEQMDFSMLTTLITKSISLNFNTHFPAPSCLMLDT